MTITDVLTIPTANQERRTLKAAEVPPQNQRRRINWTHGEWSSLTNGTMSHLEDKTDRHQLVQLFFFNLKFVKYFSVFLRVLNQTMMSSYLDQGKGLEKLECPGYTSVQTLVCSLLDVEAEHRHGQDQPPAGKHRWLLQ